MITIADPEKYVAGYMKDYPMKRLKSVMERY